MRWPARQENHDDRFVALARTRIRFRPQQLWQGQTAQAERANLEEVASRHSVAEPRTAAKNA